MPPSHRVRTRHHFRAAVPGLVALMLLAGCSGGIAQHLLDPVEQARSAVKSDQLTFDLLDQNRVTTSLAETVLKSMTDELIAAEKTITSAEVSHQGDEALRDAALAATRQATSASLAGRDCLSQNRSCAAATKELQSSAEALQGILDQLQSSR